MKKQLISVLEWKKSVLYWWSYILFAPECKELTCMLDPLLYRWGVPPVVIRRVHWTMQSGVTQTWITIHCLVVVMNSGTRDLGFNISSERLVNLTRCWNPLTHVASAWDRTPDPGITHYDESALTGNPGLQHPHLNGPVHTPDNNRWDAPPV